MFYEYVTTEQRLRKVLREFSQARVWGMDTETTGLDYFNDKIRLIQIAAEVDNKIKVAVVDLFAVGQEKGIEILAPYLTDAKRQKIFFNAKFDVNFIRAAGCRITAGVQDTMIMYRVLFNGDCPLRCSLDVVLNTMFDIPIKPGNKKKMQKSPWVAPELTEEQLTYAAADAYYMLPLWHCLKSYLEAAETPRGTNLWDVYLILELSTLLATADMEYVGIPVDIEVFDKICAKYEPEILKLDAEIKAMFLEHGVSIKNLNSPYQLVDAFKEIGCPIDNTRESTLLEHDHPIATKILRLREVTKLLQFAVKLPKHINPATGRIHCNFNQMGTVSGRFSSSNPNLQQIPRPWAGEDVGIRDFMRAREGYVIVVADYSQIELVIAAQVSQDQVLCEAYRRGEDIHKLTASFLLNKPLSEVTKEDRQLAKAVNFG